MKIIEYSRNAQTVTHLPAEVIEIVVQCVRLHRAPRVVQRDLWSCCLVSNEWYAATIKYLYEAPVLLPRNFAEFARTLSPTLASRVRRVGLEDLVQYLDMGALAYESQKSTTSRLLSRTKASLKAFVAPAVSFSTTSLAPLSKCANLQRLDLSRDQYGFGLGKLLRSIKDLLCLESLSLPKDCPFMTEDLQQVNANSWPPSLLSLQWNSANVDVMVEGSSFVPKLPPRLDSLTLNNCTTYHIFEALETCPVLESKITKLTVRVNRCDGFFNFNSIVKPFPNLLRLSIPAMTMWLFKDFVYTVSAAGNLFSVNTAHGATIAADLRTLILEESPDFPFSDHMRVDKLREFIEHCPQLLRIDVPESYLYYDDFIDEDIDDLNAILSKRAEVVTDRAEGDNTINEAGVFITQLGANAGVGLKRSFEYHAQD